MIAVDEFLARTPHKDYACFDFVREVWRTSFGVDIGIELSAMTGALTLRSIHLGELRQIQRVWAPVNPCVVAFHRGRTVPHIGIWLDGKVLHMPGSGAQYVPLHTILRRYARVSYYTCKR